MKESNYVTPEKMLKDGVDGDIFNGVFIRKGTIAAAIKNAQILDDPQSNKIDKEKALEYLKDAIPTRLNKAFFSMDKVLSWKNERLNKL
ncbi:hypothetical protein [Francisella tularensis]|uniref:hypothetical protein n=1 Tax=Francisella tularensis TaxID=263 RepID=UPI00028E36A3|nr:hypothetical protein [Francisella tularensis]AJI62140.1 hypothetical protein CH65_104 [Francisella tularensis subsp. tularensis]AKH91719.1 hypothetical protein FT4114_03425 [Francisella tularensis subsp. tularensis WY-00W4114]AKU73315.1 hypothetical protein ACX55_348 [Francisella tularensis subsp. tularensis]EKM85920.1 hypothetical protein B344_07224 [Francisella tularensis subsp. tularensis 831]EKM86096.1 hypothetical protein B345_07262 [Francisella tularensis subsp. tularensis AS_713]